AHRRANCARHGPLRIKADNVVTPAIPGTDQPAVRRRGDIIETVAFAVLHGPNRFSRLAVIACDHATLGDINSAFAIDSHSPQRHLRIDCSPLANKLSGRIENLYAPAAVLADVDVPVAVDADAAGIGKHPWRNAFFAEL